MKASSSNPAPPGQDLTRRHFLRHTGLGLGGMALGALLREEARSSVPGDPLRDRPAHFPPRARHVIYLHMVGAPSQLDLFDAKPALARHDGQPCPESFIKGKRFAFLRGHPTLAASRFEFRSHGSSGQPISELLPHLGGVADELAVIRSLHTNEFNHAPAQLFLHTGFGQMGRPSLGAWVTYGLGSANQNLPAYVVMQSGPLAGAGTSLWSTGFLPGVFQGIPFRSSGDPVLFLGNPKGYPASHRRRVLDAIRTLNEQRYEASADPEILTRIRQYEMAFRMQMSVPELMDLSREPESVLDAYGAQPGKPSFANHCLLARRLVERGVRMVQLFDADWDHHANIAKRLPAKCRQIDRPIAALIRDLKGRGLLDETLIVWGGEFGRTPMQQVDSGAGKKTKPGRDHHRDAFTMWLAGGGVKPGVQHGETDEFGFSITRDPVHVHDINATILHLLGMNHEELTYRYQGRDFRLTDIHGNVVKGVLA